MPSEREIDPDYSFRFSMREVRDFYGSADAALASGDFMTAAQMTDAGEIKGCALILAGLFAQGIEILESQASVSGTARLCHAFALWSLGREAEARGVLALIDDAQCLDKAARFRALLDQEQITVFVTGAIVPIHAEPTDSVWDPVQRYGKFTVKYVGSQIPRDASEYLPFQQFDDYITKLPLESAPDLILALSPQWIVPDGFGKVDVPKVLWCHDSDVFLFRNLDNYQLYDVLICSSSQEHFENSLSTGKFCASALIYHPMATPYPDAQFQTEKDIDVLLTGDSLSWFHPEKARFLYQLSEVASDHRVLVVAGHMNEREYFDLVARAKFVPLVGRHAGNNSPRWRDALANSACVLYPEGTFYDVVAPGCFAFRAKAIGEDVRSRLKDYDEASKRKSDYLGEIFREVQSRFAIHRQPSKQIFERFLKYATFLALVWRDRNSGRGGARADAGSRRRLVWLTPRIDRLCFGAETVRERIAAIARHIDEGKLEDERDFSNAAHMNAQLVFTFPDDRGVEEWAEQADQWFEEGLRRFPQSLLLRFNQAHWQFFKGDHQGAAEKFEQIIGSFESLSFDVRGADVALPYVVQYEDIFPAFEYADLATIDLVLSEHPALRKNRVSGYRPSDVIRSACHAYVAWSRLKSGDRSTALERFRQALEIFPDGGLLQRLYVRTMIEELNGKTERSPGDVGRLAKALLGLVSSFPQALLTEIDDAVPLLVDGGEVEAARELLASWYRFANLFQSSDPGRLFDQVCAFYGYRSVFPVALTQRVQEALRGERQAARLTQLEEIAVVVGKLDEAARAWRSVKEGGIVGKQGSEGSSGVPRAAGDFLGELPHLFAATRRAISERDRTIAVTGLALSELQGRYDREAAERWDANMRSWVDAMADWERAVAPLEGASTRAPALSAALSGGRSLVEAWIEQCIAWGRSLVRGGRPRGLAWRVALTRWRHASARAAAAETRVRAARGALDHAWDEFSKRGQGE
jgi:tetratricopeptide (TPR) repeat protein